MKTIYLCILMAFVLCCSKPAPDSLPETVQKCRLTKIIQGTHNGGGTDTTFRFSYDNDGRMTEFSRAAWGDSDVYVVSYDTRERLTAVSSWGSDTYWYAAGVQLSEVNYSFGRSYRVRFQYETDTIPTGAKEYELNDGQWELQREDRYTYENGNVVKVDRWIGGTLRSTYRYEYYENIPNKFQMLALLDFNYKGFGPHENFFYFNKNMVKKMTRGEYGLSVSYIVDAGKVVQARSRSFETATGDSSNISTHYYYYDCN